MLSNDESNKPEIVGHEAENVEGPTSEDKNECEDQNSETEVPTPDQTAENQPINLLQENVRDISNKEKIADLLKRTGYSLTLSSGQRRYGGPPPNWDGPAPGQGEQKFCSQVYIGKLGKNIFEDLLVPFLEQFGKIYELRLMVNKNTGENKGFGFCVFSTKEECLKCVESYQSLEFPENPDPISISYSPPNCRLYLGGISKFKSKEEVKTELFKVFEGLEDVTMYDSLNEKVQNRGFAFLLFKTHQEANTARKKILSGKIHIFSRNIFKVDWADPVENFENDTSQKTNTIFVRNFSPEIDSSKIKEIFVEFGEITEVKKLKDYAFVTFSTHESAENAQKNMNKKEVDGLTLEVDFSKGIDASRRKNHRARRNFDQNFNPYYNRRSEMVGYRYPKRTYGDMMSSRNYGVPHDRGYGGHDDRFQRDFYPPRENPHYPGQVNPAYGNNYISRVPEYPYNSEYRPDSNYRNFAQYPNEPYPKHPHQYPRFGEYQQLEREVANIPTAPKNLNEPNWRQPQFPFHLSEPIAPTNAHNPYVNIPPSGPTMNEQNPSFPSGRTAPQHPSYQPGQNTLLDNGQPPAGYQSNVSGNNANFW